MLSNKTRFQTADLMKTFDIGRNTLRLYEEMGLLIGMQRTEAGYREYDLSHVENLKFILKAKEAGFTLNEIKALLEIVASEKHLTCGTVSGEISNKLQEIESQLVTLQNKKDFLAQFSSVCQTKDSTNKCDVVSVGFDKKACC